MIMMIGNWPVAMRTVMCLYLIQVMEKSRLFLKIKQKCQHPVSGNLIIYFNSILDGNH